MVNSFFWGSIIPLLLMIILLKKESRVIMSFFAWGLVAFILSFYANNYIRDLIEISTQQLSVSWAPIIEELFKALPLLYFLIKKEIDYPLFYFAMASGIGFSILENYLYLINVNDSLAYIITRSVTTCLMHGMTTATIGFGITLIHKSLKGYYISILFGLFTFAVIFHALYNLYINSNFKVLGLVMAPILYMVGYIVLSEADTEKPSIE